MTRTDSIFTAPRDPRKHELSSKVKLAIKEAKQKGLNESEVIKTINGVITIEKLIGGKND